MTNPYRVLIGTEQYGSRAVTVDGSGSGDYVTIQAAIDAAQSQTPAADSRWLVRVAPGEYQESLTLYDYIDIAGFGAGYSSHLYSPANQAAISSGAEATLSNLRFGGENDPVIQTGASFTGTMRFVGCVSDNAYDEVMLFQLVSGAVEVIGSHLTAHGRIFYPTTGTLRTYDSTFTRDGGESEPPLEIAGAATVEAQRCSFLNTGSGGGAAVKITASPSSAVFHHCLFRKASGTYSIDTTVTPAVYLANSAANAAVNPAITGTHDIHPNLHHPHNHQHHRAYRQRNHHLADHQPQRVHCTDSHPVRQPGRLRRRSGQLPGLAGGLPKAHPVSGAILPALHGGADGRTGQLHGPAHISRKLEIRI